MLNVKINSFKYDNNIILKNISVEFKKGKAYCIVGDNGSGKTTFLNIISSLIPNVINGNINGNITYNKKCISFNDIDYVLQNSENSLFYSKVIDQLQITDLTILDYWLEKFDMIKYKNAYIRELSIGQKKIITCLMALLSKRPICILDEPSANLDNKNKELLMSLIEVAKKEKIIIIVSHDKSIIDFCDSIYKITNDKMLKKVKNELTKKPSYKENNKRIVGKELFKLNGFKYKFENGKTFECNKVISVYSNSVIALLGPNGSGKTTFANYIIENYKSFYKKGISKKRISCSIMFQSFYKQLFEFSIEKELLFGLKKEKIIFDQDTILKEIGLMNKKNEDPRFISDGQKRMLLISSLLMSKKDLIILDEPFDNIDNKTKNILKNLLIKYKNEGSAIIILDQTADDFYDIVDTYIKI